MAKHYSSWKRVVWIIGIYPTGNYENCSNHLGLASFWDKITRNTTWISQHTIAKLMNSRFSSVLSLTVKVTIIYRTLSGVQLQILRWEHRCNIWSPHILQFPTGFLMNEFPVDKIQRIKIWFHKGTLRIHFPTQSLNSLGQVCW